MNRMIVAVFLLSAVGLALLPLFRSLIQFLTVSVIFGLANGIVHPITMAMATDSVPYHNKGMALGVRYAAFRLGNVASPMVLGLAAALGGLNATFLVASGFSAVGAIGGIMNRFVDGHKAEAGTADSE